MRKKQPILIFPAQSGVYTIRGHEKRHYAKIPENYGVYTWRPKRSFLNMPYEIHKVYKM